jgi:hypothetical protein
MNLGYAPSAAHIIAFFSMCIELMCIDPNPNLSIAQSGVLGAALCAQCHSCIPDHLGECRDDMSLAEAQREWREEYRETPDREETEELPVNCREKGCDNMAIAGDEVSPQTTSHEYSEVAHGSVLVFLNCVAVEVISSSRLFSVREGFPCDACGGA